jgi:hypothetical protein
MRDLKKEIKNKLALEPPRISLEFVKLFGNKKNIGDRGNFSDG